MPTFLNNKRNSQWKCADSSQYLPGCYMKNCILANSETGDTVHPHCRKYSCQLHGWKKQKALSEGIEKYLQNFPIIRFWTFTMSNAGYTSIEKHYRVLAKAWRRFVTELRRNKVFTNSEMETQYIKVSEPHKSGYFHFHAFFDRFVPIQKIYVIWNMVIRQVAELEDARGYCYVKGAINARRVARYVSKYVVKSAISRSFRMMYYSKSNKISLFEKRGSDGRWIYIDMNQSLYEQWLGFSPLLDQNYHAVPYSLAEKPPSGWSWGNSTTTGQQLNLEFP